MLRFSLSFLFRFPKTSQLSFKWEFTKAKIVNEHCIIIRNDMYKIINVIDSCIQFIATQYTHGCFVDLVSSR